MNSPADTTFSRISTPGDGVVIRIDARDGSKLLMRLEMSEQDYVRATLGNEVVTAAITMRALP